MKQLYESILTNVKNNIGNNDAIHLDIVNDANHNAEFLEKYFCVYKAEDKIKPRNYMETMKYNPKNRTLTVMPIDSFFFKFSKNFDELRSNEFKDIKIDTIIYEPSQVSINKNTISQKEVTDSNFAKNIILKHHLPFHIESAEFKNVNIKMYGTEMIFRNIYIGSRATKFTNTNIQFEGRGPRKLVFQNASIYNELSGLTTNANEIKIYNSGLFDFADNNKLIDSLFDWSIPFAMRDLNKGMQMEDVKFKGIKQFKAKVNNTKRYALNNTNLNFKSDADVIKTFKLQNFTDLKKIVVFDNNVSLVFEREDNEKSHDVNGWTCFAYKQL